MLCHFVWNVLYVKLFIRVGSVFPLHHSQCFVFISFFYLTPFFILSLFSSLIYSPIVCSPLLCILSSFPCYFLLSRSSLLTSSSFISCSTYLLLFPTFIFFSVLPALVFFLYFLCPNPIPILIPLLLLPFLSPRFHFFFFLFLSLHCSFFSSLSVNFHFLHYCFHFALHFSAIAYFFLYHLCNSAL